VNGGGGGIVGSNFYVANSKQQFLTSKRSKPLTTRRFENFEINFNLLFVAACFRQNWGVVV